MRGIFARELAGRVAGLDQSALVYAGGRPVVSVGSTVRALREPSLDISVSDHLSAPPMSIGLLCSELLQVDSELESRGSVETWVNGQPLVGFKVTDQKKIELVCSPATDIKEKLPVDWVFVGPAILAVLVLIAAVLCAILVRP